MSMNRILMYVVATVICLGIVMTTYCSGSQDELAKKYTETFTTKGGENLSLEMVLIPSGTFLMGSPAGQAGRGDNEGPQHEVRLDPFYLCTTETTIELFVAYYQETVDAKKDYVETQQAENDTQQANRDDVDAITGPTPVYGDMTMGFGEKYPAIGMTWHNAMTFCTWLSKKTGKEYRLPTEAEWEYACRAGATGAFGFEEAANKAADSAWYEASSDVEPHEVAKKKPNAWGLYDMSGNVREWVYDFYSPTAYAEAAQSTPAVNPKGPEAGEVHVARGGDYTSSVEELRCAARAYEEPWWRSGDPQIPKSKWWLPQMDFVGFRVAQSVEAENVQ